MTPWFRRSAVSRLFLVLIACLATLQLVTVSFLPSFETWPTDSSSFLHLIQEESKKTAPKNEERNDSVQRKRSNVVHKTQETNKTDVSLKRDYDEAGPTVVQGRVHYLESISRRQTPREVVTNMTYATEAQSTLYEESLVTENNDTRPLYVYNPSLVALSKLEQALRDEITGHDEQAMYLASFRVSTFSNCFGPQGMPPIYSRNYLGLALLDEHLDIIKGTDIVVDVNYWVRKRVWVDTPP